MVIRKRWQLGANNPIAFIHDVGAGGLSNALPELVKDGGCGGRFELRDVPNAEPGMSPLEIWCNEAQERYVLAVAPEQLATFEEVCRRERCPYAVVGEATQALQLSVAVCESPPRQYLSPEPVRAREERVGSPHPGAFSAACQTALTSADQWAGYRTAGR